MKKMFAIFLFIMPCFAYGAAHADFGAGTNTTWTVPSGKTELRIYIQGAGGAGAGGCNSKGGGGGGRGALAYFALSGVTPGTTLTIIAGTGGYAPTVCNLGNIGTQSSVAFPNGWTLIAGGGQRGIGQMGGAGGNVAETGTAPSGVTYGQVNLGSEIGQNAVDTTGGAGAGNGDTGHGGNGGNAGQVGYAGNGGYIHIEAF